MNRFKFFILLLLCWYQTGAAQNEYTFYVPDALATGFGGSAITFTESPAIVYWNPGGIAFATNDKVLVNISTPFFFNYLTITKFFPPYNSLGFSLSRLPLNDNILDVMTAAYSRRLSAFFSIGGSINYSAVFNSENHYVTASIGCLLKPAMNRYSSYQAGDSPLYLFVNPALYDKFALGVSIHNIPLSNSAGFHDIRIGSSFKFSNLGPLFNLGYHIHGGKNDTYMGIGFNISPKLFFFTGLANLDVNNLAFGGSINVGVFYADVGYSPKTQKITISVAMRLREEAQKLSKRYVEQGTRMIRESNFRGALTDFKKALSYNQNNERVTYLTNILQKRIEQENIKIDSLLTQAIDYQRKGWFVNATLTYKEILEIDPQNKKANKCIRKLKPDIDRYVNWLYRNGKKYFRKKELEKSKSVLKEILQLRENHRGALKYLAKIDSINSYLSNEYFYRAVGYYKQRRLEKSRSLFVRVLELNPDHEKAKEFLKKINQELESSKLRVESLYNQAYSLEKQGKYLLASKKYREILNINRDFEKAAKQLDLLQAYIKVIARRKFNRGKSLFNKGNYADAKKIFEELLTISPRHGRAKYYLKRIKDIQSKDAENYFRIAEQYFEEKKWNDALDECEKVLALAPNHAGAKKMQDQIWTHINIEKLEQQGIKYYKKHQYSRALDVFNQIIEKEPHNKVAKAHIEKCQAELNKKIAELFNSGMDYYTSGDYKSAIREWDRILQLNPNHESAREYKKRAQERQQALKQLP